VLLPKRSKASGCDSAGHWGGTDWRSGQTSCSGAWRPPVCSRGRDRPAPQRRTSGRAAGGGPSSSIQWCETKNR